MNSADQYSIIFNYRFIEILFIYKFFKRFNRIPKSLRSYVINIYLGNINYF